MPHALSLQVKTGPKNDRFLPLNEPGYIEINNKFRIHINILFNPYPANVENMVSS